jgi:hypothetical protein
MQKWDRRVTWVCAVFLCLMAIGHAVNYSGMSYSLAATAVQPFHADAIRDVWLTISAMLACFGLLLLRAARIGMRSDAVVLLLIGAVLIFSGLAGLMISGGQPFWYQDLVLGLPIVIVGWRTRRAAIRTSTVP